MLDMGFIADMRYIVTRMKARKQTLLFSATLEASQKELISEFVQDPERVQVSSGKHSNESVEQEIVKVPADGDKFQMLLDNIQNENIQKAILFMETKRQADRMGKKLSKEGITNGVIHGDRSQSQRIKSIDMFKLGKVRLLVATDVAARGLDINDVTHVINYQVPLTMDSYIHRIGRTGRAGKTGKALTFVD
jgi:ATP-dependent RNA helicase RhlE